MVWKYKELELYKMSRGLVRELYCITGKFPECEKFGLVSQIRRAVVSVVVNIAEGSRKRTSKNFVSYLNNSAGSLCEVGEELSIAYDLGYLGEEDLIKTEQEIKKIDIMLARFIDYVTERNIK